MTPELRQIPLLNLRVDSKRPVSQLPENAQPTIVELLLMFKLWLKRRLCPLQKLAGFFCVTFLLFPTNARILRICKTSSSIKLRNVFTSLVKKH